MIISPFTFWSLVTIALGCGLALIFVAVESSNRRERLQAAERKIDGDKFELSARLNWLAITLGGRHPQIDPICKAIEAAVQSGRPIDTRKLEREIQIAELGHHAKGGAS